MTRTQTDATFVNGNHDPLFYLRQANSSLAGLMTAAGYTKLNDMPAAQEVNAGLAYDVSVLHPTSGVSGGSTYASLSAALAVIPQDKRKGGMTVKFVQSIDNNYVQYLYKVTDAATVATFTNVANWEKMNLEKEVSGLIINADYEVDTNAKRSKNYTIASGTKIVIKVTKTGGSGLTYSAYWIKEGGNVAIFTNADYGYISDVLTVPNDATGVNIFMAGVAAGNTRNVKIYDASFPAYLAETTPKLEERVATEEGKTATLEGKVSTLEGEAVVFTGTNGASAGTKGFVPAPAATDKDKYLNANGAWVSPTDYFYNSNVNVNTNSQRSKDIPLASGSKIVVRVSVVSGTSSSISLSWIKAGGNVSIISGYPMGYMTGILTVPDDATGINVFMFPAASGNVNKIEVWDATKGGFIVEKLGQFGFDYINNRKLITKTITIPANNSAMDVISFNEGRLANLSGDIYAYISANPKIADNQAISFWNTDDVSSASVDIAGLEMRQDKVFKIWGNKTLSRVTLPSETVSSETELTITVFAIEPSSKYLDYPLYGKKIMCFGDSLTQFKSGVDNKRYSDHLQEYSQATVVNAGIGGTRFAQRQTPSLTPTDNQQCVAAFDICNMVIAWATEDFSLQEAAINSGLLTEDQQPLYESKLAIMQANPISNVDVVTIMAGANDYRGGSQVGTESQSTNDKGTIFGAINTMVSTLLTAKPTLQINFFSPLILMFNSTVSLATSSDVYVPSDAPSGLTFPEYIEKIEKAVKGNHCPYYDMYWSLGFNVYNWQTYFGNDYSHPYYGFQVIAERMYKYLLQR